MKNMNRAHGGSVASFIAFLLIALGGQALAQGTWETKAPMPTPRSYLAVGVLNGILYAVGGLNDSGGNVAANEAYDPVTDTWTTKAPMPTARFGLAVGVANGILYAVGGRHSDGRSSFQTMEAYDPVTNTWTTKAPMPTARQLLAVGVVNGVLYAVGGAVDFNGGALQTVEAYDPVTNTWTRKAPMPTARWQLAVGVVNGVLYAVGGETPGVLQTLEAYDPVTNTWTTNAPMPTARTALAAGVVERVLYAVGGSNGPVFQTVEAYDPATDTWTAKTPMPTARSTLKVGVVDGILYAVGGVNDRGGNVATNEAFTPADRISPVLNLPGDIAADATSPAGAVVSYTVTATDNSGVPPIVVCEPASGSTFPIGVTRVNCTATDGSRNSSSGSFTVTVNGPGAQAANLISVVQSFNLAQGISNSLDSKLDNVLDALNAANAGNRADACNKLDAFINNVSAQSGKELTSAQAAYLIASANQIRAAQGCP